MTNRRKQQGFPVNKFLLIFALTVALAVTCHQNGIAATYYCDPEGNWTTGNGSAETPWGTLGRNPRNTGEPTVSTLETKLSAGDTVICTDGYHGYIVWAGFDKGAYVTFKAEHDTLAILSTIDLEGGNHYIKFEGFKVYPWASGTFTTNNVLMDNETTDTHITYSKITSWSVPLITAEKVDWNADSLFYASLHLRGDSISVVDCTLKNSINGLIASAADSIWVHGCTITGFLDDGIKVASRALVEDCIIGDCYGTNPEYHNDCMQIFGGDGVTQVNRSTTVRRNKMFTANPTRMANGGPWLPAGAAGVWEDEGAWDITVENNVMFLYNIPYGIALLNAVNCRIVNNTVVDLGETGDSHPDITAFKLTGGSRVPADIDSLFVYNNMVGEVQIQNNPNGEVSNNYQGYTLASQYDVLVDVDAQNAYPLATADSLINNGTSNTYTPDNDIRGYVRPDTTTSINDIGAYEFDAAEEGEETPEENPTLIYASLVGSGDSTGVDGNNCMPIDSVSVHVTAGDTVRIKSGDLTSAQISGIIGADSLIIIFSDAVTISGISSALSGWTVSDAGGTPDTTVFNVDITAATLGWTVTSTVRDTTAGYALTENGFGANTSDIWRNFVKVALPDTFTNITGGRIDVKFYEDYSTAESRMFVLSSYQTTKVNASWSAFYGNVFGSKHTGAVLADTTGTETINLADGDSIISNALTASGLDTLNAALGDTLRLVIMGHHDYWNLTRQSARARIADNGFYLYIYDEGAGESPISVSKDIGYVPRFVWINDDVQTIVDDSTLVSAAGDTVAIIGTVLYVATDADTTAVEVSGNIGINNNGYIGTIIKGGGNLFISNFNVPFDSIQYVERTKLYNLDVYTGVDSSYRVTVANADSTSGVVVASHFMTEIADAKESTTPTYTLFNGFSYLPSGTGNDTLTYAYTGYDIDDYQDWSALRVPYGYSDYAEGLITVTSPDSGEVLTVGNIHNITWTNTNVDSVKIYFNESDGDWTLIATDTDGSPYAWTVPDSTGTTMSLKIVSALNSLVSDESDADWTIEAAVSITVTVSAPNDSLKISKTMTITAEADSDGVAVTPVLTVSDTDIATIAGTTLTAVSTGEVLVIATYGAVADSDTVLVYAPTPTTVVIEQDTTQLDPGDTLTYSALVYDEDAELMPAYADSVVWASGDTLIFTVSETGLVTGVATGSDTLTAAVGEVTDYLILTVTAPSAWQPAIPGILYIKAPKPQLLFLRP